MDIFTMYYMYNIAFVFYGDLLIAAFAIIFIKQKLREWDTQRMSVSVLVESLEFFMEFTSSTKTNFETVCILTETENQRITKLHLHE